MASSNVYMYFILIFVCLSCCPGGAFQVQVNPSSARPDGHVDCGGAWINQKFVVTSASCFEDYGKFRFKISEPVFATVTRHGQFFFRSSAVGHVHGEYTRPFYKPGTHTLTNYQNDVALLKLTKEARDFPTVKICGPEDVNNNHLFLLGLRFERAPAPGTETAVKDVTRFARNPLTAFQFLVKPTTTAIITDRDSGSPVLATASARTCGSCIDAANDCLKGIVSQATGADVVVTGLGPYRDWINDVRTFLLMTYPEDNEKGKYTAYLKTPTAKKTSWPWKN